MSNLEDVLRRLDKVGIRLKREKCVCVFMPPKVVFLGRRVTAAGIMPCDSKVEAIKNASKPENCVTIAFLFGFAQPFCLFLAVGEHSVGTPASVTSERKNLSLGQGPG